MSVSDWGYWRLSDGRRGLLTWNSCTGVLEMRHPAGQNILLAVIADELDLRRRLEGWAEHCTTREGLGWLAQRLEGCR